MSKPICFTELPGRSVAVAVSLLLLNAAVISVAIVEDRQSAARKRKVSDTGGGLAGILRRKIGVARQSTKKSCSGHSASCAEGSLGPPGADRSCLEPAAADGNSEYFIGDDFIRALSSLEPRARQESSAADVYNLADGAWHVPACRA